jgi:hypothetical protein
MMQTISNILRCGICEFANWEFEIFERICHILVAACVNVFSFSHLRTGYYVPSRYYFSKIDECRSIVDL